MARLFVANINIPLLSAIAALLAALAAAAANLEKIVTLVGKLSSWLSSKRSNEPVLLRLNILTTKFGQKIADTSIPEEGSSLLDITISYEGSDKIIFDRIDVLHEPSILRSVGTGALQSSAKYSFQFKYASVVSHPLSPPLVINPQSESLLRFEVEFAPEGTFPTTGGRVSARVRYHNTKGRAGVLPLYALNPEDYRDYPELYERITRRHEFLFSVFGGLTSRDQFEVFKLTRNYLIKGKPEKALVALDHAVQR